MNRSQGFKYGLMKHLSDATSISAFSVPIKALTDQFAGISNIDSIETRAKMVALNYLGLVQLVKLRDYTKKKSGISRSKNKALHYLHDIAFTACLGIPIQVGVYLSSGVSDWKEIAATIGGGLVVTSIFAGPLGQFIDTYRELMRVKKSNNTPAYFKRIRNDLKRKVGVVLVAGSMALTGLIYSAIPDRTPKAQPRENPATKQILENKTQALYSEKIQEERKWFKLLQMLKLEKI